MGLHAAFDNIPGVSALISPIPAPSGVVVGALPKEEKLRELELEFKALGGKDRQRISSMDLRSQQKLGALQRQIDFLVRYVFFYHASLMPVNPTRPVLAISYPTDGRVVSSQWSGFATARRRSSCPAPSRQRCRAWGNAGGCSSL